MSSDEAHLPALGLRCQIQRIDPPVAASVDALLASADAPAAPPTEPVPLTLFEPDPVAPRVPSDEDEPGLRLRLLGPITVEGVDLLPQQLAFVAFLALHPDTTGDALREAIWGGRPPTRDRFTTPSTPCEERSAAANFSRCRPMVATTFVASRATPSKPSGTWRTRLPTRSERLPSSTPRSSW